MSGGILTALGSTSIATRVFVGPFLGLGLTVAALALADWEAERAVSSIDATHEAASGRIAKIDDLLARSYRIHSDVSRHLALADSGVEEARLARIRDTVATSLDAAAADAAGLRTGTGSAAEADGIADMAARLAAYGKSARNMNLMASQDRLIAIPLMADVDAQFSALMERVLSVQTDIRVATERATRETREASAAAKRELWLVIAGVLVAMLAATLTIARSISGPIKHLTECMGDLAAGKLDLIIFGVHFRNEIGAMAHALQVFQENARAVERLKADQERRRGEAEESKRQIIHDLADLFEARVTDVVADVSTGASRMRASAAAMLNRAKVANDQASAVAAASQQMGTNVQAAAASAEELYTSILGLTEQARKSFETVRQAVQAVDRTNSHVTGLSQAADRIGEIVQLINSIASQTNLLALNATIEAARAGDAGRGFAVVASEVKNLANQTAKATEDIASQIKDMQQATGAAVDGIKAVGGAVMAIDRTVGSIAEAMEQQSEATMEIARNVAEAATGTNEVSHNIVDVSQVAHEAGSTATEVLQAAERLDGQAVTLNNEVKSFIGRLRHG